MICTQVTESYHSENASNKFDMRQGMYMQFWLDVLKKRGAHEAGVKTGRLCGYDMNRGG